MEKTKLHNYKNQHNKEKKENKVKSSKDSNIVNTPKKKE